MGHGIGCPALSIAFAAPLPAGEPEALRTTEETCPSGEALGDPATAPESASTPDAISLFGISFPRPVARACDRCQGETYALGLCEACARHDETEARRKARIDAVVRTIPPRFRWAKLDAPEALGVRLRRRDMVERVAKARELAARPVIVIVGGAGKGKTSLACAMLRERGIGIFVPAWRLSSARIQHRAGDGEPAIVEQAMRAPLLLLDDLGSEERSPSSAVGDVIRSRHDDDLPIWVTTWMDRAACAERYGDGVARRLFDGAVVTLDERKEGTKQ